MKYQYLNIKWLAIISLVGLAYNIVIVLAMHKLQPAYNPRSRYISEYVLGKYGRLVKSSLVVYGLATLGVVWCLQLVLPDRAKSTIGLILLAISGMTKIVMSIFNVDLKGEKMSLRGTVHSIAFCTGVAAFAFGSLSLSFCFPYDKSTQSIAFVTQIIAIIDVTMVALVFTGLLGDLFRKYKQKPTGVLAKISAKTGFYERLLLGISTVWLVVIVLWILDRQVYF